jgi:zinc transporter ZupT
MARFNERVHLHGFLVDEGRKDCQSGCRDAVACGFEQAFESFLRSCHVATLAQIATYLQIYRAILTVNDMLAIISTLLMFISTLVGGYFAVRYHKHLRHILGLTAGIILGVVAFDILPEMFELADEFSLDTTGVMVALVAGFLGFHVVEKLVLLHHEHEGQYGHHRHPKVGMLSALALGGHSLLDGIGIGLAFQVHTGVGMAVALALVAHKFADGLSTASLMLAHHNTVKRAFIMVGLNAILPIIGALSTLLFVVPESWLPYYLAFYAGFLLYIGASDILPQAHDEKSDRLTIGLTIIGVIAMFAITHLLHAMHAH